LRCSSGVGTFGVVAVRELADYDAVILSTAVIMSPDRRSMRAIAGRRARGRGGRNTPQEPRPGPGSSDSSLLLGRNRCIHD